MGFFIRLRYQLVFLLCRWVMNIKSLIYKQKILSLELIRIHIFNISNFILTPVSPNMEWHEILSLFHKYLLKILPKALDSHSDFTIYASFIIIVTIF